MTDIDTDRKILNLLNAAFTALNEVQSLTAIDPRGKEVHGDAPEVVYRLKRDVGELANSYAMLMDHPQLEIFRGKR